MEYAKQQQPVTRGRRRVRREVERLATNRREEENRQRSRGGGKPDELGDVQGQNGEQVNSIDPRQTKNIGRTGH